MPNTNYVEPQIYPSISLLLDTNRSQRIAELYKILKYNDLKAMLYDTDHQDLGVSAMKTFDLDWPERRMMKCSTRLSDCKTLPPGCPGNSRRHDSNFEVPETFGSLLSLARALVGFISNPDILRFSCLLIPPLSSFTPHLYQFQASKKMLSLFKYSNIS